MTCPFGGAGAGLSSSDVLLTGRKGLDTRRTADRNALNALVRTTDLGVDAHKALTGTQIRMIVPEAAKSRFCHSRHQHRKIYRLLAPT